MKPKMKSGSPKNEEIDVSRFKDINIHFAGDVYLLAVWIAMSDRAKSTSTSKRRTTLTGLAAKFSSIYGIDYDNPIGPEDVMKIFERHGIRGNPLLCLDEASESSMTLSLAPGDNLSSKKLVK